MTIMIFPRGYKSTLHAKCMKKNSRNTFTDAFLYAYLQCLRACWKPGENINVNAGDGVTLPFRALADSRAGVILRRSADRQSDERKQGACYHLHAGELLGSKISRG